MVVAGTMAAQLPVKPPSLRTVPQTAPADACPLTVFIDEQGALYESRFAGRYKVTEQTLRNDLSGGCKEKGRTSSVRIQPSPHTKFGRVQQVLVLMRSIRPDVPITTVTPHAAR